MLMIYFIWPQGQKYKYLRQEGILLYDNKSLFIHGPLICNYRYHLEDLLKYPPFLENSSRQSSILNDEKETDL